jgi:L-alanine-DL-glutamate epimerase-like enolase superfamily enzyme
MQFDQLRITHTEVFKLDVPLKQPFVISLGTITDANNLIVRIHTNGGLYGMGEACPFVMIVGETQAGEFEIAKNIAQLIKGKNPLELENRLAEIARVFVHNPTIRSAFDMALYDIVGKFTGLPLYTLLGGAQDRVITTDMTVGIGTPAWMAQEAQRYQAAGFPAIKIKLGTNTADDVARVRAIRAAVGDSLPLRIDANQGWDVPTAVRTLHLLAPFQLQYCEEPVAKWNNAGMAHVRAHSPVPIMADESLFDSRDACDYFNIKLSKSGGLSEALRIVAVAESAGIGSQVGCMSETRLGLSALAHLVLARRSIHFADLDSGLMHSQDPVVGGIQYLPGGEVRVPNLPGIGADIKPEWLARAEKFSI